MNVIEFGSNGKSDKVITGGIYRTQDLSVVAIMDVRLDKDKQPIGQYLDIDKVRELPLVDQWVFSDTKSIDIMITELSDLKGKLEKKLEKRCERCEHFHRLKHNFEAGTGFEESNCCDVLLHLPDSTDDTKAWVQEVSRLNSCEMFTEAKQDMKSELE